MRPAFASRFGEAAFTSRVGETVVALTLAVMRDRRPLTASDSASRAPRRLGRARTHHIGEFPQHSRDIGAYRARVRRAPTRNISVWRSRSRLQRWRRLMSANAC